MERSFDFPMILVEILVLPMVVAFGGISFDVPRGIDSVAGLSWLGESTFVIPWARWFYLVYRHSIIFDKDNLSIIICTLYWRVSLHYAECHRSV
jgi:hypothetical protein